MTEQERLDAEEQLELAKLFSMRLWVLAFTVSVFILTALICGAFWWAAR